MKKWICPWVAIVILILLVPAGAWARGTRYLINWPEGHIGPVYVQIYDIRCTPPYERLDNFKVWVTWGKQTKCYAIGNRGVYLLKLYKYDHCTDPMIISGNADSFSIRYSLAPPWI